MFILFSIEFPLVSLIGPVQAASSMARYDSRFSEHGLWYEKIGLVETWNSATQRRSEEFYAKIAAQQKILAQHNGAD